MDRVSDDEGTSLDDRPPDDADDDESDFAEKDPTGRYGRYDEVLGKGAYKTVYKAFDEVDGIEVAWNQMKVQDMLQNPGDKDHLYSELHLLKTLKHKNIIKFYYSWVDIQSNNVNFITEIFTSGTLRQYCKKHRHVDLKAVKNWSRQILRGLLYLHGHDPPIIHRDLKCDNIFINGNQGEVKIGDLGLAAILQQAHAAHSVLGTPEFMAPELYEEEYNELVDIYSFGMCLLEMITFEYPYSECANAAQIYKKVTTGKRPAALDKVRDPQVREFVEKCLASASQRLHARELLNDPFLRSEGECETVEPLPYQPVALKGRRDLKELNPIPEESLSHCALHYGEQEKLCAFLDVESSQAGEKPDFSSPLSIIMLEGWVKGSNDSSTEKNHRASDSPYSKEEGSKRNRDFRIKGKKQDDMKILVRIRITNLRGEVRYIQFDFDVEGDTAMCVASEMVAELDLSDQDVTTIAEMIDAEILSLVPDWKPEVALDEVWGDDEFAAEQGGALLGDLPLVQKRLDGLSPQVLENTCIVSTAGGDKKMLTSPKIGDLEAASGPRNEGLMYGRFEDVGYRHAGSDHKQPESDTLGFFSDSSDQFEELDESELSLDSSAGRPSMRTVVDDHLASQLFEGIRVETPSDLGSSGSAIEFMDCPKVDFRTETGLDHLRTRGCPGSEESQESPMECYEADLQDLNEQPMSPLMSKDKIEEDVEAEELRLLTLQHEQEIQLLRSKHEQALLDLKIRLQGHDGLATRVKVLSGEPMQATPGLMGLSVSTSRDGCQSSTDIESQNRAVEANVNKEHGTGCLEVATVTLNLGVSEFKSIDLAKYPIGPSPSHMSGYKVNVGANVNDLVSQAEVPSLEKSINGNSESHALGKFDSASREGDSWIAGPSETSIIAVLSNSRQFVNAPSMSLGEEPKTLMVSRPVSKMGNQEAVTVSCISKSFKSLNGLQEATFDTTRKEPLMRPLGTDLKLGQAEASNVQNLRGKFDFQFNNIEKEKTGLLLENRDVASHDTVKMQWSTLAKRESYLEFYKAGVTQKDKLYSSKPSEFVANGDISAKAVGSKSNDLEQLKKVQLQKSIAELEAKTLEGLCQSKTKYLVGNAVKNYGSSSLQGGQPGSATTLAR